MAHYTQPPRRSGWNRAAVINRLANGLTPGKPYDWADETPPEVQNVLSHVTIERSFETMETVIRRKSDGAELVRVTEAEIAAADRYSLMLDKLSTLVCAECGCPLLNGERDLCGGCESTAVMDLIRMNKETQ